MPLPFRSAKTLVASASALAIAALVAPGFVRADPPCPNAPKAPNAPNAPYAPNASVPGDAAHGGRIATAGDGSRFEVVQDVNAGTLTVFALPTSGKTVMLATPPTLVIAGGPEIALVAMPGRTDAWSATNEAFRRSTLVGHLRMTIDGKEWTALVPVAEPSPANPTSYRDSSKGESKRDRPRGPHGGKLVAVSGSDVSLEIKKDKDAGSISIWPIAADGRTVALESPVLVATYEGADSRRIVLNKNADGAFAASDPALRNKPLTASLEAKVDGKTITVPLHSPARTGRAMHGGKMLSLGDGAPQVELVRDTSAGTLTIYGADESNQAATLSKAPQLSIDTASGARTIAMTPALESKNAWTVSDPALRDPSLDGSIKAEVNGRQQEVRLSSASDAAGTPESAWDEGAANSVAGAADARANPSGAPEAPSAPMPPSPAAGPEGSAGSARTLVFGANAARLEVRHDAQTGKLSLTPPSDAAPVTFDDAPTLALETSSGTKDLTFEKDSANSNGWVLTSSDLKTASPKGVVRVRIGGTPHDSKLEAAAATAAKSPTER